MLWSHETIAWEIYWKTAVSTNFLLFINKLDIQKKLLEKAKKKSFFIT